MQEQSVFKGVDVAKAELLVATEPATEPAAAQLTLRNERAAIGKWLRTLAPGTFLAMESTGRYHHELAQRAVKAGMKVYVLNARDVHFYATALGKRGKTDACDAQVIARYLGNHHKALRPWTPGTPAQQRLG